MSVLKGIRELGGETIAYGFASVASSVFAIFLIPLYTRVLSPADYGLVALVTALTGVVSTFVVLGLDSAAGRWFFDDGDDARRGAVISSWFWCQLGVSTAAAAVIVVAAPWIGRRISDSPAASLTVTLAALSIPFATFRVVAALWLRCNRLAWRASGFLTFAALSSVLPSAVLVLLFSQRVPGVFLGRLAGAVATAVFGLTILRGRIRPRQISPDVLSGMVRFGLPLIPTALAAWITASSDRIILNVMLGESAVGIYSVAVSVAAVVALFTGAFDYAWGPFAFAKVHEPGGPELVSATLSWFTIVSCCLATAISLFAPEALRILTTPKFYGAASAVPYLAFSFVAFGLMSLVAIGANIAKKSSIVAASIGLGALINIAFNIALIPLMGRDGAAAATLLAYLGAACVMYVWSQRHFVIPYRLSHVVIVALWSGVAVAIGRGHLTETSAMTVALRLLLCCSFVALVYLCGLVRSDRPAEQ